MSDTQKHTKPNVPNLRFPGFDEEWRKTHLSQMGDIIGGGTPDTTIAEYWNGNILWFTPSEVGKEKYVSDSNRKISLEGLKNSSAKNLPKQSILLSSRATVGECSINLKECCTNQGFQSFIPNNSVVSTEFLYYRLLTHKRDFIRKACGSTFLEISARQIAKISSYLPEKREQDKIASLLSLIDKRISIQSKVIEDLKKLKAALCTSLFSQGRTISVALSDVGESFSIMNLSKEDLTDYGAECILYGELFTTYGRVIKDVKCHTSIETNGEFTTSGLNDLLFPASTTVDAISLIAPAAISKPGVILGGDMFGIRLNAKYNNRYMSNLLYHCYRRELASYAQGSTIIHLHYRDIKRIKIAVHPKNIQDYIADTLDLLDNRIANEQKMAATYACQKAYLIGRLFI